MSEINYIEQLNAFWLLSEEKELSSTEVSAYLALLNYCNRLYWTNPFICHWEILCQYSRLSKNAHYKALDRLNEIGLINYDKGKKNTSLKPKIFILKLENKEGINREQRRNNEGIEEEQKGNLYKLDKLLNKKTIKLLNDNAALVNQKLESWIEIELNPKEEVTTLSFRDELFTRWIKYRKEIKKPLKETSVEALKNTWQSKSDIELKAIINQSIANGWQGLFELKQGNNQQQQYQQEKPIDTSRPMKAYEAEKLLFSGKLNT